MAFHAPRCGWLLAAACLAACLGCNKSLVAAARLRKHHPAAANSSANSSATFNAGQAPAAHAQTPMRSPRIYFLFMAVDKVSNLGVWNNFFATAPMTKYRAFVHCKLPSCEQSVANTVLKVVPTVPSYYCTDLVSPMNQLLNIALNSDTHEINPQDKFVFISDSSLPAKPFEQVYSTLSARDGSDFCLFPSGEWADIPSSQRGVELAPKHHQWLTLDRGHASSALQKWWAGEMHNLMSHFRMNTAAYTWSNNTFADSRNFGCLDEFWHMTALFGPLRNVNMAIDSTVTLPQFTGGPIHINARAGWQGTCDTFVVWAKYLHAPGYNPFQKLHSALDPASVPHSGNAQRPGWWDTISAHGISAIRQSDFLFVRKFIDMPTLVGGGDFAQTYSQIVLY